MFIISILFIFLIDLKKNYCLNFLRIIYIFLNSEKSNFLFDSKSSLVSDIDMLNKQKVDLIKTVQKQFDE